MSEWNTTHVEACLARIRAGDAAARDDLFAACRRRLLRLVRRTLRTRFPDVRRWEDTADVFQGVCVRLDRALRGVPVATADDFLRLASHHIRLALLDLARKVRGPHGVAANHATPARGADGRPEWADPPDPAAVADLDWWGRFHEEAGRLPDGEREAVALTYYSGLTRKEVAHALGVSVSTVKRWLATAYVRLCERLGDDLPDDFGGDG